MELRARDALLPLALLTLLVLAVGVLAYHERAGEPETLAAILWSALALAASVGGARAFVAERERGTLGPMLALPVERSTLYLSKVVVASLTLLVVGALAIGAQRALGAAAPSSWPALGAILVLGAVGLAATTTMVGALAAQARSRDVLLPILALPLLVPLLISAVHGTVHALEGDSWRAEALVLLGYDVAFLGVSALLVDEVLGS